MKNKFTLEFSENKRVDALIKLTLYLLFLFLVIFTFKSAKNKIDSISQKETSSSSSIIEEEVSSNKEINYNSLRNELILAVYQYKYDIYFNDQLSISYEGKRIASMEEGIKKTDDGYIKYYIDGSSIYEEKLEGKELSNNLYNNVEKDLIDSRYILEQVESLSPIITDNTDTKEYKYNLNNEYEIIIKMDYTHIYEIDVNFLKKKTKYILSYIKETN